MGRDQKQKVPEVPAGVRRQWAADRAMRPPMRSPGRPEPSRAVQRHFWRRIAAGVTTAEAAVAVGVSCPVGTRWFRHAGGMPLISLDEPTGRYLSFAEREAIALLRAQELGVREIARRIGRDAGTVSRELRRNAATRGGKPGYRALVAQWKAQQAAKRPKTVKLAGNERLREYVQERLAGSVRRPDGMIVTGPETPEWKGLNKPHRQDSRWALRHGARSRSRTGSMSTSPMMSPCASATKRSTRRCSSRDVARSSGNWSCACAPAGRCGFPCTVAEQAAGACHRGRHPQ